MPVDGRVSRELQLRTTWGDALLSVERVPRGAAHANIRWVDATPMLAAGLGWLPVDDGGARTVTVDGLALEARWVAPVEALPPAAWDLRLGLALAHVLLFASATIAALVLTPAREEAAPRPKWRDEHRRFVVPQPPRHVVRPPSPAPSAQPSKRMARVHEHSARHAPRTAATRALFELFQGAGASAVFSARGLSGDLAAAAASLHGSAGSGVATSSLGFGARGSDGSGDGPPSLGAGVVGRLTDGSCSARPGSIPKLLHTGTSAPLAGVKVEGGLDRDVIRRVVQRHQSELRFCYEQQLQQHPGLGGKLAITWTIDPTGGVSSAELAESTVGNDAVESCALARIRRWKFPEPAGGGVVVVTFPWLFHTAGDE